MDFRVSRQARDSYGFEGPLFSARGDVVFADPAAARRFARRMVMGGGSRPDRPVNAGEIDAIGLIHEIQHLAILRSAGRLGDRPFADALASLAEELGESRLDATLATFDDAFPTTDVYAGSLAAADHLDTATDGIPNREIALEEVLLLWVANQNPGFMGYGELFDDAHLEAATDYERVVGVLRSLSSRRAELDPRGEDLVERLLEPGRVAPTSLAAQLRWILETWGDVVDDELRARGTLTLDVLTEEEVAARQAFERHAGGPGPGADSAALHGFGDLEYERFSQDRDWMPNVVLMAKSTYVWLDQLSRSYGRPIWTLDGIPDEELDRLRDQGITGLWLIGLWERSHASQRIKQLRGNSEAVASAYSLMDYRIADDLGGETAYADLRNRAWARGIRLASDMVPNHMGIDSRWVIEHPDWFVQRSVAPYPAYSFNGPNLSRDERVGIYIEDHYYDNSDAAVVFKRTDRWSGQERYIYHGNDGTSFPWNDTAQLDYLRADVREAVIQTILSVARRFPIIRFDAAMTLARKHVQRLWYPLPGQGGAIPSRSESALTQEQFDAAMPYEFWREVVDRVAAEAPDTLLLAEAFWLLEGYFVRTLGMHRVYNSAFMHMLRDEKNAEYRTVIRETMAFDPEILKRYVNFMNNPDERTAIEQFGDGDKYFGVATMLATLPGLPMIGHGQIEGFGEKYGMEFRRATLQETPNEGLVHRHEHDIFPLLRQRWRFADARDFRLYDFETGDGLNENVFAYSNGGDGARSLIVYHNRYAETRGWVRGCAEGLGVGGDADDWLILRDHRSGLEYLRNGQDLHARGLEMVLNAYECHAFVSLEAVRDGAEREWARLAWRLGLAGVPDVRAALADQRLEPLVRQIEAFLEDAPLRRIAGAALGGSEAAARRAVDEERALIRQGLGRIAADVDGGLAPERVDAAADALHAHLAGLVERIRPARAGMGTADDQALHAWLGTRRERWAELLGWAFADAVISLAPAGSGEGTSAFDGWQVDRALGAAVRALGLDDQASWRTVELVRALLQLGPGALAAAADIEEGAPSGWYAHPGVRAATGWNEHRGVAYVNREAYEEWLETLAARETAVGEHGAFLAAQRLAGAIAQSGYRVSPAADGENGAGAGFAADADAVAAADIGAAADVGAEAGLDAEHGLDADAWDDAGAGPEPFGAEPEALDEAPAE